MKPLQPDRFTLPATARGRELADQLVSSMHACERTATLSEEIIECKTEGLIYRVLVVECGPRPNEGSIARNVKATHTKPLGRVILVNGKEVRTSLPEPTADVLERIKRTQPFWDRFK